MARHEAPRAVMATDPRRGVAETTSVLTALPESSDTSSRQFVAGQGLTAADQGAGASFTVALERAIAAQRVTTGSINPSTTVAVVLSWAVPFVDASYTPVATAADSTGFLTVVGISTWDAGSVTVNVLNNDAAAAHTGTLCVLAIHD